MATTLAADRPRLWAPARHRSFRLLWTGQALSLLGDGFTVVAFSWITLSLTGSTLTLGYVLAFQAVPRALLTLVGGTLGDTWSTRTLMVASSWTRSALMAAVGIAGLTGHLTVWMLCAAAAAFGAVDAFFQPARVSILPSVVDEDLLAPANALLGAGARTAAVLGPAVGGTVIALTEAPVAFLVDAVCFALCGLCVARIRTRPRPDAPKAAPEEKGPPSAPASAKASPSRCATASAHRRRPRHRGQLLLRGPLHGRLRHPRRPGAARRLGHPRRPQRRPGRRRGPRHPRRRGGRRTAPRRPPGRRASPGWLGAGMAVLGLAQNTPVVIATVLAMGFAIGYQGVFGLSWIQRNIPQDVLTRVVSVDMVLGYAAAPCR